MKKFFDKFSDNEGNEFFELNSFRDDIPVELLLKNKTKNHLVGTFPGNCFRKQGWVQES